jgi:hypothetical protein
MKMALFEAPEEGTAFRFRRYHSTILLLISLQYRNSSVGLRQSILLTLHFAMNCYRKISMPLKAFPSSWEEGLPFSFLFAASESFLSKEKKQIGGRLVDGKGFEPSTPTLRTWCSPS